jgi:ABC-2 type transport system permease protein
MMASMFDPTLFEGMEELFKSYPEAVQEMVGGQIALSQPEGFIHTYLITFSWMYIGIYLMLKSSQDIPKEIDNKTIDLILSKPIKRWEFFTGKYFKHVSSALIITLFVGFGIFLGIFLSPGINPAEIYYAEIVYVLVWNFVFLVSLISTAYFFSAFLNPRMSLSLSFGALITFYILGSFSGLFPEEIQGIKYFSLFGYFQTAELLVNQVWDFVLLHLMVLVVYSVVVTIIAGIIFNKRDIPV